MTDNNDRLFARWSAPNAPDGIRQRVLATARDPQREPIRRRLEDRLWESRTVRHGWLAAASALLALNLVVGTQKPLRQSVTAVADAPHHEHEFDVGIELPFAARRTWTMVESQRMAKEFLGDPCLAPLAEGDCT